MLRVGLGRVTPINARTVPPASFLLNFADLGSGVVSLVEGAGNATPTFTRATVAQALKSDGTFVQVASGSARSWYSNNGGILLGYEAEGARTNLCIRSQSFGSDWVAIGTPTRVAATTVLGSVQLDTIGDDSAAALEGYSLAVTFTGDAVKSCGLFMKAGTSTSTALRLRDGTASANRLLAVVTWAGTVPTVTMTTGTDLTGTVTAAQLGTSGVYWVKFSTSAVTAANSHQIEVYPASDAALSVGATGTVEVGVVNEEDATFPSSPIITTGATVTRNADVLTYPITLAAAYTYFISALAPDAAAATFPTYLATGGDAGIFLSGTTRIIGANMGGSTFNTTLGAATAKTVGTAVKIAFAAATNDAAGTVNGEAPTTDATFTPTTGAATLFIGCNSGNVVQLFAPISSIRYFPQRLSNSVLQQLTT